MPVRILDPFITASNVRQTESTASLSATRLGIDANHWLKRIFNNCKDPTLPPLGGTLPLALKLNIEKDILYWRNNHITPIVVFSGFAVRSKADRLFAPEQSRALRRTEAWDAYMHGNINSAHSNWNLLQAYYIDMQPAIMHILKLLNVDFIRAPYSAWGQLTYFLNHPKQIIHAVFAGTDLLMFDVDRIITAFDFTNNTFSWVDKNNFLATLTLTKSQFLDSCILAGFDWISTYPPLSSDPEQFSWSTLCELVRSCQTGISLVERLGEPSDVKERYKEDYARVRCGVRHHLILNMEGDIEPLEKKNAPIDLHDVFGHKLPPAVYWHLAQGHISPSLVSPALFSTQPEFAPACGGECIEYQTHVKQWATVRAVAVILSMQDWGHAFWHQCKLTSINWYQPFEETIIDTGAFRNSWFCPNGLGSNIHISTDWIANHVPILKDTLANDLELPLLMFLTTLSKSGKAAEQSVGPVPTKNLDPYQLAAVVSLKFLDIRGMILSDTHLPSPLGKAFMSACNNHSEFQFELILVTELLRDGVLHGNPFSRTYQPIPKVNPPGSLPVIVLLTRLACALEPSSMAQKFWTPELNRDLLAVSSLYKHTARTLHSLLEGILLSYARHAGSINAVPFVTSRLPFALIHGASGNKSAAFGLFINAYLVDLMSPSHHPFNETTLKSVQANVVNRFEVNIPKALTEIDRFGRFLKSVSKLIHKIPTTNNALGYHNEFLSQNILRAISWWELVHSGSTPHDALTKAMSPSNSSGSRILPNEVGLDSGSSSSKISGRKSPSPSVQSSQPTAASSGLKTSSPNMIAESSAPTSQSNQQPSHRNGGGGGRGHKNRRYSNRR